MCAANDLAVFAFGAGLARLHAMDREPPTYIEINVDEADGNAWLDEKTARIDFDRPTLTAEEKLVFGYLTMEQHGIFGGLSLDEQEDIAATLKG
jgi:hypothetical protein